MRHSSFFLLLILLISFEISSQSVLVSEEIPLRNDVRYELLNTSNGKTLLFRDRIFEQDVLGFDENMRNNWVRELDFEKKRIGIIGILERNDGFTLLYHFRERMNVFVVGRTFDDQAQVVSTDTLWVEESMLNTPEYYLSLSKDHRYAVIFETKFNEGVLGRGIDVDRMQMEWKHIVKVDDANVRKDFRQALVTNDGHAYLVFEKDNRWNKRKTHSIEILRLDQPAVPISINVNDVLCYDLLFEPNDQDNRLVGACSYSESSDNRTDGIKSFIIDMEKGELTQTTTFQFDEKLLQDIYGKKVKKKKGLKDLVIRHLQPRVDGGLVIVGELSKEYSRRPSFSAAPSSAYTRRWVDYYFEDIVAVSIHPDGKIHWSEVLHKRQYSQDDDAMFSSFFVFETPSQLRIMFNDEIRSENTVSEYIVTGRGLKERKSLMSTDYQNLKLRFREAKQTSGASLIVPSLKGNRLTLVKIDYNES